MNIIHGSAVSLQSCGNTDCGIHSAKRATVKRAGAITSSISCSKRVNNSQINNNNNTSEMLS